MAAVQALQNSGISGWMKYQKNELPVVRASTIYWSALRTWRMLNTIPGLTDLPTERQLQSRWPLLLTRDDGDEKEHVVELFENLPPAPTGWANDTGRLDFNLRRSEAEYIRAKWRNAGEGGAQPLLSRLAEADIAPHSLWSTKIRNVADVEDRRYLLLAEKAASVACIARAAFAALVETKRGQDGCSPDYIHREALQQLRAAHRDAVLAIDLNELRDATQIDGGLTNFLRTIIDWVRLDQPLSSIAKALETRESDLKDSRAYLVNQKRRAEWSKGVAVPLDYRWPVVRNMIVCLRCVS
jgi:hypothetical protein